VSFEMAEDKKSELKNSMVQISFHLVEIAS